MRTTHSARLWAFATATGLLVGCTASTPEPCAELCDGIARCRQGNDACIAAGSTDYEPLYGDCVTLCETTADSMRERAAGEATRLALVR